MLRAAEEALWTGSLFPCLSNVREALAHIAVLPASAMPRHELRVALNIKGVALHLAGRYDDAEAPLEEALRAAERAAASGLAHDQLVCVAGALNDVGANALAAGDTQRAAECIKRADYMLSRAYRPNNAAKGAVRVSLGLLHSANGDNAAALSNYTAAKALLGTPARLPVQRAWLHAAHAGAMRATLAQGDLAAAQGHSAAALAALELPVAACTRDDAMVRCIAALVSVEALRGARGEAGRGGSEGGEKLAGAARALDRAARALEKIYGSEHTEVNAARANASVLSAATARGELPPVSWAQPHWIPAVGIGIALDGYASGVDANGAAAAG